MTELTYRDLAAIVVAAGLVPTSGPTGDWAAEVARRAYAVADALEAQRAKGTEQ